MKNLLIVLLITLGVLLVTSCSSELPGSHSDYSFSKSQLEKGIVNKYYLTIKEKGQKNKGDVFYRAYKLIENDTILAYYYNAAKEITRRKEYNINESGVQLISNNHITYNTEIEDSIIQADPLHWESGHISKTLASFHFNDYRFVNTTKDSVTRDTLILSLPSKEIISYRMTDIFQNDEWIADNNSTSKKYYSPGLYLIRQEIEYENATSIIELIEQMSISDFQELEIPYKNRIGYIDPNESWSPEGFEVCTDRINDYYNWVTPELNDGKKELEDFIYDRYDPEKYRDQSGYLSIHFVINCKGETGRFVDRSHSLDFKVDSFSDEIKDQMMTILNEKKGWIPQLNDRTNEFADVYHYVTFRIENGEIDEILP